MKRIISIDPSICSLGWAEFSLNNSKQTAILKDTGSIHLNKGTWIERLDTMINRLLYFLSGNLIVLIELPHIYTVGQRGIAAGNSESIMKLCAFVFALRESLLHNPNCKVILITVQKWKGNLPKVRTAARMKKHWKFESDNDDIVDAVGIGSYYIKEILKFTPIVVR